jgi:hypothetical protein
LREISRGAVRSVGAIDRRLWEVRARVTGVTMLTAGPAIYLSDKT